MNKTQLSERDICTKFSTPALRRAGWDEITQLREEVSFTKGRMRNSTRSGPGRTQLSDPRLPRSQRPKNTLTYALWARRSSTFSAVAAPPAANAR
jgi:hypothetical protein